MKSNGHRYIYTTYLRWVGNEGLDQNLDSELSWDQAALRNDLLDFVSFSRSLSDRSLASN